MLSCYGKAHRLNEPLWPVGNLRIWTNPFSNYLRQSLAASSTNDVYGTTQGYSLFIAVSTHVGKLPSSFQLKCTHANQLLAELTLATWIQQGYATSVPLHFAFCFFVCCLRRAVDRFYLLPGCDFNVTFFQKFIPLQNSYLKVRYLKRE